MLNFDEEVKKFHSVLEINDIEEKISADDMSDLIDLVKKYTGSEAIQYMKKDSVDKEL